MASSTTTNWVRTRRLGHGSFGTVSLALHAPTSRLFAVKSVDLDNASPTALHSLENEIRILRSISSPYVVGYLGDDVTREQQSRFRNLHIEYMPGGTLADKAKLDERDLRAYLRCALEALRYLHSIGVVHGDVKGRNILVGHHRGSAKLADFGSARKVGDETTAGSLPQGTPLWMAPEVVRGGVQTPESDVWSLGCTVVEMATGKPPWEVCGDVGGALFRIGFAGDVPELPPGLSEEGRDFMGKCLRLEARERWSCEELLRHPFVGGVEDSPRSVVDWLGFSSSSEEEEEGEGCTSRSGGLEERSGPNWEEARRRVRDLAARGGGRWWEEEGWEEVRMGRGVGRASGYEGDEMVTDGGWCSSSATAYSDVCSCFGCCVIGDGGDTQEEWRGSALGFCMDAADGCSEPHVWGLSLWSLGGNDGRALQLYFSVLMERIILLILTRYLSLESLFSLKKN